METFESSMALQPLEPSRPSDSLEEEEILYEGRPSSIDVFWSCSPLMLCLWLFLTVSCVSENSPTGSDDSVTKFGLWYGEEIERDDGSVGRIASLAEQGKSIENSDLFISLYCFPNLEHVSIMLTRKSYFDYWNNEDKSVGLLTSFDDNSYLSSFWIGVESENNRNEMVRTLHPRENQSGWVIRILEAEKMEMNFEGRTYNFNLNGKKKAIEYVEHACGG